MKAENSYEQILLNEGYTKKQINDAFAYVLTWPKSMMEEIFYNYISRPDADARKNPFILSIGCMLKYMEAHEIDWGGDWEVWETLEIEDPETFPDLF